LVALLPPLHFAPKQLPLPTTQTLKPRQPNRGSCNTETLKDVAFIGGAQQEAVAAGSDGGLLLIWARDTGKLLTAVRADRHAVNVIAPHPTLPYHIASCGIDDSVKLWSPCSHEHRGLGPCELVSLAENELKRAAGHAAVLRARELGLGDEGWVPGGGMMRGRYLTRTW